MKAGQRLIITNLVLVVIPVLAVLLAIVMTWPLLQRLAGDRSQQGDYESIRRFLTVQAEFLAETGVQMKENPEKLLDPLYQRYIALRASEGAGGGAVVFRNGEILFDSTGLSGEEIRQILAVTGGDYGGIVTLSEGRRYAGRSVTASLKDGTRLELVLTQPLSEEMAGLWWVPWFWAGVFFGSFLAVNAWAAARQSAVIVRPLKRLSKAAAAMGEGQTDFVIPEEGDAEVRELCQALEQTRLKLRNAATLARQYDDNRKMLVSSISHDLKTPITAIRGYVEGILDGVASSDEKRKLYLEMIRSRVDRLNVLIDDLLLYSLLDMAQVVYCMEETDAIAFYSQFADDSAAELAPEGISVRFENGTETEAPVRVRIDREKMSRVLTNLLDNTRKYGSPPSGEAAGQPDRCFDIRLRLSPGSVIAEVRDNGPGIPEDQLEKIFTRFYRGDAARGDAARNVSQYSGADRNSSRSGGGGGGSGLGLAIARQIVEDHGGRIWARNRRESGKTETGTSIMISLPRIKEEGKQG